MAVLFIFLKNFVHKAAEKIVNKERKWLTRQIVGCWTFVIVTNWTKAVEVEVPSSTEFLGCCKLPLPKSPR